MTASATPTAATNEKTSEGLKPSGQAADAKAAYFEGDPQTLDIVVARFCKEFELPVYEFKTLAQVIKHLKWKIGQTMRVESPAPVGGPTYPGLDPEKPFGTLPAKDMSLHTYFQQQMAEADAVGAPSAFEILKVCLNLAIFLMKKNKAYGDSALKPLRVMSHADPVEQIRVRMDDKLSRLMRGQAGSEDAMQDLVGYWVLLRVAEAEASKKTEGRRNGSGPLPEQG